MTHANVFKQRTSEKQQATKIRSETDTWELIEADQAIPNQSGVALINMGIERAKKKPHHIDGAVHFAKEQNPTKVIIIGLLHK